MIKEIEVGTKNNKEQRTLEAVDNLNLDKSTSRLTLIEVIDGSE